MQDLSSYSLTMSMLFGWNDVYERAHKGRMLRFHRSAVLTAAAVCTRNAASSKRGKPNVDPTRGMVGSKSSTDMLQRKGPGSTKVIRVKNKTGRVFEVSIPITKITHPQKKLVSPLQGGSWTHLDTSYVDVGDFDADVPSPLDEAMECGENAVRLAEELKALCVEYVAMDNEGMVSHEHIMESNVGPDYEMEDRKTIRRRKWFTIVHKLNAVRTAVWPSSPPSQDATPPLALATAQYECLSAVAAASTFGITKKLSYEDRPDSDYQAPHMQREVLVTCQSIAAAGPLEFFSPDAEGLERLTTVSVFCNKYQVPFAQCVAKGASVEESSLFVLEIVDDLRSGRRHEKQIPQKIAAGLLMTLTQLNIVECGDPTRELRCLAALDFLFGCCTRLNRQEALAPFDGDDVVALLQVALRVRTDNPSLFATSQAGLDVDTPQAHFVKAFQFHVAVVVDRCRALLYHRAGGAAVVSVETEDGFLPIVEMQQNAERRHPGLTIHHKIGMSSAQGHRPVHLELRHTARLLNVLQQLEASGALSGGADAALIQDLHRHMAVCLTASQKLYTLQDLVFALEAAGRRSAAVAVKTPWESNRMLAALDQLIGGALHELLDIRTLADVTGGFAACDCVPQSLQRIYAVGLRLLSAEALRGPSSEETLRDVARFCDAAARLHSSSGAVKAEHMLAPIGDFSAAAGAAPLPPTIAEKAGSMFAASPIGSESSLAAHCSFARSMFAAGHPSVGASAVQDCIAPLTAAAGPKARDAAILLALTHQHASAVNADDIVVDGLRDSLTRMATLAASVPILSSSELLQMVALHYYLRQEGVTIAQSVDFGLGGVGAHLLESLTLSEIAFLHAHIGLLVGQAAAAATEVQSALHRGLLHAREALVHRGASLRTPAKRPATTFTLASLDHIVRVRDTQPRWAEARWASIVALQTPSPSNEALATVAAQILGVYMHLLLELKQLPSPQKASGFELSHVLRSQETSEMDEDLAECGAALEAANKLSVAEEQFDLAHSV